MSPESRPHPPGIFLVNCAFVELTVNPYFGFLHDRGPLVPTQVIFWSQPSPTL